MTRPKLPPERSKAAQAVEDRGPTVDPVRALPPLRSWRVLVRWASEPDHTAGEEEVIVRARDDGAARQAATLEIEKRRGLGIGSTRVLYVLRIYR